MIKLYHISAVIVFLSVSKGKSRELLDLPSLASGIRTQYYLPIDTGLAQVTFLTQPQDATVTEGGNATFRCEAEENGMALLFGWDIAPVGGSRRSVITGSQVAGVSMVTVSGDRTQLTLSGVQREADGLTVHCSAIASTGDIDSNPATIAVQCEYSKRK